MAAAGEQAARGTRLPQKARRGGRWREKREGRWREKREGRRRYVGALFITNRPFGAVDACGISYTMQQTAESSRVLELVFSGAQDNLVDDSRQML